MSKKRDATRRDFLSEADLNRIMEAARTHPGRRTSLTSTEVLDAYLLRLQFNDPQQLEDQAVLNWLSQANEGVQEADEEDGLIGPIL